MLKKLKRFTRHVIAGANAATIIIMVLVAYSDRLYPDQHPYMACLGLLFPVFLVINLLFLIFWTIFHKRCLWIPLLGYILCFGQLQTYLPLNIGREEVPKGALKVISYNVQGFQEQDKNGIEYPYTSLDYLTESEADIICTQEAQAQSWFQRDKTDKRIDKSFKHHDHISMPQGNRIAIYTRFPILKKERIMYASKNNASVAFHLNIDGDTVIVINNHFENCHLDTVDRRKYDTMLKGEMERGKMKGESRRLLRRLAESARVRCAQVDSVTAYIRKHHGKSIILCGDFNDSPISYTHREIGKQLTDCYKETGIWAGLSYNKREFPVRIDYIFCSDDLQPYQCHIDKDIKTSDHYPIVCWVRKR